MARARQHVVGPQCDASVTRGAGKADALGDEPLADAEAARGGLHDQQAQFGGDVVLRTTNTDPTFTPSRSAIQHRSEAASNSRTNRATISATSASKSVFQPYSWA